MAISTVAFRYAKSLIDLAQEKGLTEDIHNDMQFFKQTVDENRSLLLMLQNPVVRVDKKTAVLNAVFSARLNPMTMDFIHIIDRKHRESIMDAIADEYIRLYNKLKGIQRASVTTTTPLTDALREEFKAMVANATGANSVELEERIDQKLIGGYVLRLGDRQIDASLRNQLNDIKLQFLS
jgi:F-type H+-transporting ATPase subunit delta